MNALEAASLVMIPSGYEDGTLGSLKPLDGTGDFTFSRGSNISATRVNADGYIEKGYENLLLQSNQFDTTWISGTSCTGGQEGYDGSNNAWKIQAISTSNQFITQNISLSSVNSFSVYAKAGTANFIIIRIQGTQNSYAYINLLDGTIGNQVGSPINVSTESVGNGWYRCEITNSNSNSVYVYVVDSNGSLAVTSGAYIYIQDAMVNQGMVAYPYVETTTAPVAGGILEDMPRLDYSNGSCPSLLLEPSRTNLITSSEYFGGYSQIGTMTISSNSTTSPEGVQNATLLNNTSGATTRLRSTNITSQANEKYVMSIFAKANGTSTFGVRHQTGEKYLIHIDLSNQSYTSAGTWVDDIDFKDYGNGWWRVIFYFTADDTTTGTQEIYLNNGESVYFYGWQFEQDATYPTSYIPTYGVSQTRLQDSASVTGLAQSFPLTAYIEIDVFSITTYNQFQFRQDVSNFVLRVGNQIRVGATDTLGNNTLGSNKFALSVDASGNYELFKNGTSLGTGTITGSIDEIRSDAAGYEVKQLLLFSTALSDEECIALTTIS